MAEVAVAAGTRTIVATPHVNLVYDVSPEEIEVAVAELNVELARREIGLNVLAGAEVAHWRLADLDDATLARLRLGDGPYLLVECPITSVLGPFEDLAFGLQVRGFGIVLAHPERSLSFQKDPGLVARLVRSGMLTSVTAASLAGQFGRPVTKFADQLFRDGLVHGLASDAHDHQGRPPDMLDAFLRAERRLPGLRAQADWLTRTAPAAILAGEALAPRPAHVEERRWRLPWQR